MRLFCFDPAAAPSPGSTAGAGGPSAHGLRQKDRAGTGDHSYARIQDEELRREDAAESSALAGRAAPADPEKKPPRETTEGTGKPATEEAAVSGPSEDDGDRAAGAASGQEAAASPTGGDGQPGDTPTADEILRVVRAALGIIPDATGPEETTANSTSAMDEAAVTEPGTEPNAPNPENDADAFPLAELLAEDVPGPAAGSTGTPEGQAPVPDGAEDARAELREQASAAEGDGARDDGAPGQVAEPETEAATLLEAFLTEGLSLDPATLDARAGETADTQAAEAEDLLIAPPATEGEEIDEETVEHDRRAENPGRGEGDPPRPADRDSTQVERLEVHSSRPLYRPSERVPERNADARGEQPVSGAGDPSDIDADVGPTGSDPLLADTDARPEKAPLTAPKPEHAAGPREGIVATDPAAVQTDTASADGDGDGAGLMGSRDGHDGGTAPGGERPVHGTAHTAGRHAFSAELQNQAPGGNGLQMSSDRVYLRLHDEGLGRMHWHLNLDGGRIAAEAVVDNARVQEILRQNEASLQAGLQEAGMQMEGFDVSVDQGSQRFGTFSDGGSQHGVPGQGDGIQRAEAVEMARTAYRPRPEQQLDLYI